MTVAELLEWLGKDEVKPEYKVAIWIKDGSGHKAVDVWDRTYHEPDEHSEGFIAFHLPPD